ncbi:hypothetical protein HK102_007876 [Quaeritorhiza haematococci]|nr:hypothetical protein HK102_007876 [Quaeritorhiza haematococci]
MLKAPSTNLRGGSAGTNRSSTAGGRRSVSAQGAGRSSSAGARRKGGKGGKRSGSPKGKSAAAKKNAAPPPKPLTKADEGLLEACVTGDLDEVYSHLWDDADVNCRRPVTGWSPLALACRHGHWKVAAILIQFGADKSLTDDYGVSALHCVNNLTKTVQVLIEAGSDVTQTNNDGRRASELTTDESLKAFLVGEEIRVLKARAAALKAARKASRQKKNSRRTKKQTTSSSSLARSASASSREGSRSRSASQSRSASVTRPSSGAKSSGGSASTGRKSRKSTASRGRASTGGSKTARSANAKSAGSGKGKSAGSATTSEKKGKSASRLSSTVSLNGKGGMDGSSAQEPASEAKSEALSKKRASMSSVGGSKPELPIPKSQENAGGTELQSGSKGESTVPSFPDGIKAHVVKSSSEHQSEGADAGGDSKDGKPEPIATDHADAVGSKNDISGSTASLRSASFAKDGDLPSVSSRLITLPATVGKNTRS